ncbi:MAG: outer membrane beta-barrel protein [Nitrospiraceae bacterium]|nr:outer membrane beta-barrel protein [Nitrospiraceae bacterium]
MSLLSERAVKAVVMACVVSLPTGLFAGSPGTGAGSRTSLLASAPDSSFRNVAPDLYELPYSRSDGGARQSRFGFKDPGPQLHRLPDVPVLPDREAEQSQKAKPSTANSSASDGHPALIEFASDSSFRNAAPALHELPDPRNAQRKKSSFKNAKVKLQPAPGQEAKQGRQARPLLERVAQELPENPEPPTSEESSPPAEGRPAFSPARPGMSESLFESDMPNLDPAPTPSERDLAEIPVEKLPDDPAEEAPEEPEPLKLKPPFSTSPWNLANLQSPLFGTEEITELTQPERINTKGLWNFRPHLSITTLYDGNVFIQEDNRKSDFLVTVSPGVGFQIGNALSGIYLTTDYTASAVIFFENSAQNSLDHRGNLNLRWSGAKLSLGLQVGFAVDSGTSIDASDRVNRLAVFSGISSHYQYSPKISFDLSANYRPTSYENLIGSNETRLQGYVNYTFTPKVTLGLGGSLGLTNVERGGSQTSEEVSVRATWSATEKLTLTASSGVEFRQFENGGAGTVTPVFGLDAAWAIREGTNLNLGARRSIFSSAVLENQNYTSTGFSATVQQRMTDRFSLSLSVGYDNLDYTAAGAGVDASRQDSFLFARPSIQCHIVSWCNIGLFYEYSENFSSGEGSRSFQRDRAGLQVSITY